MKVVSNYHEVPLLQWNDLTEKEQAWWLDLLEPHECWESTYFRYRGHAYSYTEFLENGHTCASVDFGERWRYAKCMSLWSGIVVGWFDEFCNNLIVGRYYS